KSHMGFESFLGLIEFIQNINLVKLLKHKKIKIQNQEIFNLILGIPPYWKLFTKLILKLPHKYNIIRKRNILTKHSLLELYIPNFIINTKAFQLPCSIKSSMQRAIKIVENINLPSQKTLFIGDDDLVSILCKFIYPELPITVIEIDGRITKLLKEIAEKNKFDNFNVYNIDFKELNEYTEYINNKYSVIHVDPPYEVNELQMFFKNISLILDERVGKLFLNGLYNDKTQPIINKFIMANNLIVSKYYKSFNTYPLKSLDSKFLENVKRQAKLDFNLKFKEKQLKKMSFSSDFFLIEKSWKGDNKTPS
ncbi:MAG: bis-aminopropyl spermidine synthase family protein, partial [Promethearchaeota archaeon]